MYLYHQEFDFMGDSFEQIWMVSLDIGVLFLLVISFLLPLLLPFLVLCRFSPLDIQLFTNFPFEVLHHPL
jgi:hypothetical protein